MIFAIDRKLHTAARWWAETTEIENEFTEEGGISDGDKLLSKLGEIVACMCFGIPPEQAINIGKKYFDIVVPKLGIRIDVKACRKGGHLCWPRKKATEKEYNRRDFHYLMSVAINDSQTSGLIKGVISKENFLREKDVKNSGDSHPNLFPGTWLLPKNKEREHLRQIDGGSVEERIAQMHAVVNYKMTAEDAIRQRKQFEFISGRLS